MARITIQLPDSFVFETDLTVRVSDLNYGNHVGNDSILTLMQEARTLFYRNRGFESEVKLEGTIGQIVTDAAIVYKSEFLGDVLRIQVAVGEPRKYGFDLYYLITQRKTGKQVALGKTGIVCFDYAERKMVNTPASVLLALSSA